MTANSSSNCIIGERNLCTPNGKIAALLIDMDGTTVVCQPYFDEAAEEFATFMSFIGVTKDVARETLRKVYSGSMPHRGFERERFPEALIETYELLAGNHAVSVPPEDIENVRSILKGIGSAPYFRKPKLFSYELVKNICNLLPFAVILHLCFGIYMIGNLNVFPEAS